MNDLKNINLEQTYTLEKHLKSICSLNPEYIDLYATWELDKKTYENMLSSIVYNYPHFSMHESSHSKSIINNIEMILGENRIKLLGPTETWMILQSSYLHDFGMLLKNRNIEEEWEREEFQDYLKGIKKWGDKNLIEASEFILGFKESILDDRMENNWPVKVRRYVVQIIADYFRGKHAKMSRDYINNATKEWGIDLTHNGLIKNRLFRLIGEISFLHGEDFKDVLKLDYICNGIKSDYIHPRFIAEMIRLGDLLDLDNGRFNDTVCNHFGELPQTSKHHVGKHASITYLLITPELIEVSADCMSDNEVRETRRWFDMLRTEINSLTINWTSIMPGCFMGYAPKIGNLEILRKGKKTIGKETDLKFLISQRQAFEIIEGAGIYKNSLDFIRELVQNSLDASKIQLWRDIKNGVYDSWIKENVDKNDLTPLDILDKKIFDNYKVIVEIEQIENKRIRLIVKDKGIGFNNDSLLNMSNVGCSWDERENFKKEVRMMPDWLKPTGGFGVGIQSCFMVTDEVNIKSRPVDELSRIIKLKSGKENGYINVEESEVEFEKGTEITVEMPQRIKTSYSLGGYVDSKLKEYDSFENKDTFDIWMILEYMGQTFQSSLFPLVIKSNKNETLYPSLINKYYKIMSEIDDSEEEYLHSFDKENYNKIIIWNKKSSTYIEFTLTDYSQKTGFRNHTANICFKGVNVDIKRIPSLSLSMLGVHCDLNGMKTTDTLTIDRKSIRQEAIPKVVDIIEESIRFMLDKYKVLILENPSIIKKEKLNTLSLKLLCDIYLKDNEDANRDFNRILIENCDHSVKVLKKGENNIYKEENIQISDGLRNFPYISFIDMESIKVYEGTELKYIDIESLLNESNLEYEHILIDENITNHLKYIYPIYGIRIVNSDISKDIYINTLKSLKYPIALEANTNTIEQILRKLACKEVRRIAVQVVNKYKNLSISQIPYEIWSRNHYVGSSVLNRMGYFMISPITNIDYNNIKTSKSKEEFRLTISNREDFNNLVEYVYDNRSKENKASKENIREDYIRLIEDYYELMID